MSELSGTVREKASLAELSAGLRQKRDELLAEMGQIVVGMGPVIEDILVAMVSGGHILFEGVPGMAKTLLVKTLAEMLGCVYSRIQFTPDLLPTDITGASIYNRDKSEFQFHKGPIFCNLLLADEINRAPAKTQSALLEAMQEKQLTIEGQRYQLEPPFLVMATQNPVEQEGVYRLPEAQLDRFLMRLLIDYPSREDELQILRLHARPLKTVREILTAAEVAAYQARVHEVQVKERVYEHLVDLGRASRSHEDLRLGASPRALVALLRGAQARALLHGRDFVTHADLRQLARPVLNHRMILRPEVEIEGRSTMDIIDELVHSQRVYEDR